VYLFASNHRHTPEAVCCASSPHSWIVVWEWGHRRGLGPEAGAVLTLVTTECGQCGGWGGRGTQRRPSVLAADGGALPRSARHFPTAARSRWGWSRGGDQAPRPAPWDGLTCR